MLAAAAPTTHRRAVQHRFDPAVPIEEVAGTVGELVQAGRFALRPFRSRLSNIRRAHATYPSGLQSEILCGTELEADLIPVCANGLVIPFPLVALLTARQASKGTPRMTSGGATPRPGETSTRMCGRQKRYAPSRSEGGNTGQVNRLAAAQGPKLCRFQHHG